MKLFSLKKPLVFDQKNGMFVVNNLARNHKYTTIAHPSLGKMLVYQTSRIPNVKVYFNLRGKFVQLERKIESRCDPLFPDGKSLRIVFEQRHQPNGDIFEISTTYQISGNVCIERRYTLQLGSKIYVVKFTLRNGKWQKKGELPKDAARQWNDNLRAFKVR